MCEADFGGCLKKCEARDSTACYALALDVQARQEKPELSEALFLHACRLGVASGCTNRAAGMLHFEPDRAGTKECAARTFEMTCDRGDPWGCTMFGLSLMTGQGVDVDIERALAVLPGGCAEGSEDPACVAAQELIRQIQAGRQVPGPEQRSAP
jgi:hypothetical protein